MPSESISTKVKRPKFLLIGLSKQYYVVFVGGDSLEDLVEMGEPLLYYSVYVNKPGLYTSTQREYLVHTERDPLWLQVPEMSVQ